MITAVLKICAVKQSQIFFALFQIQYCYIIFSLKLPGFGQNCAAEMASNVPVEILVDSLSKTGNRQSGKTFPTCTENSEQVDGAAKFEDIRITEEIQTMLYVQSPGFDFVN